MPSVTLHMVLAERVLAEWSRSRGSRGSLPFDADDPVALNAFYQGAVGPDLGYFPGGQRLLSDLAHLIRSGGLARELVLSARTSVERAFAWGWVSHVLADREIHPLIGEAVGELLLGTRGGFIDGHQDLPNHVRVETGLDIWFAAAFPARRARGVSQVFDATSISFISRAFGRTYGVDLGRAAFLSSHRASVRMTSWGLTVINLMARGSVPARGRVTSLGMNRRRGSKILGSITRAGGFLGRVLKDGSPSSAFLNPLQPADWLVDDVNRVLDRSWTLFQSYSDAGIHRLEDFNLDTGKREAEDQGSHSGTSHTRQRLEVIVQTARASSPSLSGV